jgi:hypothetical protein
MQKSDTKEEQSNERKGDQPHPSHEEKRRQMESKTFQKNGTEKRG